MNFLDQIGGLFRNLPKVSLPQPANINLDAVGKFFGGLGNNFNQAAHFVAQQPLVHLPQFLDPAQQAAKASPTVGQTIVPFVQHRIIEPAQTAVNNAPPLLPGMGNLLAVQNLNHLETGYSPSLLDRLKGSLAAAQTAGNVVAPGATLGFAGFDALKGALNAARNNQDIKQGAVQGFTGEKFTGLGDAVTNNKLLAGTLNTGEIIAPFAHGAINRLAESQTLGALQRIPGVGVALKDISPNAFTIHPDDEAILKGYVYRILNPKLPDVQKLDAAELKDLQSLAEHYLGDKFRTASTKKIGQAFEYFLARNGGGEAKLPKLNFVGEQQQLPVDTPLPNKSPLLPNTEANQIKDSTSVLPDSNTTAVSAPGVPGNKTEFAPLPIRPNNKVGLLDQFLNRSRNVIAKQGPAGKQLAGALEQARNQAEITAGNWVQRLPTVRQLTSNEFHNFVDVAEAKAQPINDRVAQAAKEWTGVRDEVYALAKQAGLDIGKLENYFPHIYDQAIFTDKNRFNQAVNHLVESGQAETPEKAVELLRNASDVIRNRRQGNLELERLVNLPDYQKTKDALFGYLESAANRIAQVQTFGPKDENALGLIAQIGKEGGDAQTAKDMFDTAVGAKKYGETATRVSSFLRRFNTVTKLGTGAITNVGQNVNTATVVGGLRTLLNAPKAAFSPEAKDFALKAGVTLDGVLQDLREGGGFSAKVFKNQDGVPAKVFNEVASGAPGFNTVEKFNRTLAAWAGKDYAETMARAAAKGSTSAKNALAKLGLDAEAVIEQGGKLTEEQLIQAARSIVERTQFKVDPQDLPGWTASPWGKLLTQFRTFSYNQSAFIGREILGPAVKERNVAPLLRFMLLSIPVGAAITETKNVLRNRKSEEDPNKRLFQYFSQAGGLGLGQDIATGLFPMNGKYLDPNRATTLAIGTLGGPTLGNIADFYGSLTNAVQGKPQNLGRFALRQVPLVGSTLQNTILPYGQGNDVNRRFNSGSVFSEALLKNARSRGRATGTVARQQALIKSVRASLARKQSRKAKLPRLAAPKHTVRLTASLPKSKGITNKKLDRVQLAKLTRVRPQVNRSVVV